VFIFVKKVKKELWIPIKMQIRIQVQIQGLKKMRIWIGRLQRQIILRNPNEWTWRMVLGYPSRRNPLRQAGLFRLSSTIFSTRSSLTFTGITRIQESF